MARAPTGRSRPLFAALLGLLVGGACDGSAGGAGTHAGATTDAGPSTGGAGDTGSGPGDFDAPAAADAPGPSDAAAPAEPGRLPPTGLPLPPGVRPPRRLLAAGDRLTGSGTSTCSHLDGESASRDRWCVFMRPAGDRHELWVINVSQAARAEIPACDGSNPHCLRLTQNLWTSPAVIGGPVHPYSHEFFGDTLLFYADAVSRSGDLHRGPVYAWRPGWATARAIAPATTVSCLGHPRTPLALCLEDFAGDPMDPDSIALAAGPLEDAPALKLARIGNIRPTRTGGTVAWQAELSPDGKHVAVSSPEPDPAVETLRVLALGQTLADAPVGRIDDASAWQISDDGREVYFYRATGVEQRSLHVADFPTLTNLRKVSDKVRDYLLLGDARASNGLVYLTEIDRQTGALRLLRDARAPESARTVFTHSYNLENVEVSPDLRFTAWSDSRFNMRVVRNDDLQSCDVNTGPQHDAFSPWFTADGSLLFWRQDSTPGGERLDGYFAHADGCQAKQRFALGVDFTIPIDGRGLIFGDEFDPGSFTVSLKVVSRTASADWPTLGAIRIRGDVDSASLVLVGPAAGDDPLLLLFSVSRLGPEENGVYLFGPVPF